MTQSYSAVKKIALRLLFVLFSVGVLSPIRSVSADDSLDTDKKFREEEHARAMQFVADVEAEIAKVHFVDGNGILLSNSIPFMDESSKKLVTYKKDFTKGALANEHWRYSLDPKILPEITKMRTGQKVLEVLHKYDSRTNANGNIFSPNDVYFKEHEIRTMALFVSDFAPEYYLFGVDASRRVHPNLFIWPYENESQKPEVLKVGDAKEADKKRVMSWVVSRFGKNGGKDLEEFRERHMYSIEEFAVERLGFEKRSQWIPQWIDDLFEVDFKPAPAIFQLGNEQVWLLVDNGSNWYRGNMLIVTPKDDLAFKRVTLLSIIKLGNNIFIDFVAPAYDGACQRVIRIRDSIVSPTKLCFCENWD